jgi:M6 family metalloprotease-like protein
MSRSLLLPVALLGVFAPVASAQSLGDVDLLAQVHGTRPPPAYYALKARDPAAFQFQRAWTRRTPRGATPAPGAQGTAGAPAAVLGPRGAPVQGTFHFPMVLGLFADSPELPPFVRESIQREFFDGPNGYYKTIPEFYAEMSGGKVTLVGHTHGWIRATLTREQVTAGQSALPGRVGDFILQALTAVDDGSIDWGRYDNDGPDGVPNSIDDDGFVDILAVMHPTAGAECNGDSNKVWSHKWNLQAATGQTYRTASPSTRGGVVRINDYTIQPAWACGETRINQIGVFAHELGHAFGLPDLYCTSSGCAHSAVGRWSLMGSGAWGCQSPPQNRPDRPCPMGAWEKAALGWVDVETLLPNADLGVRTLGPVASTRKVVRVDAGDGSGDYFLLENRQAVGLDEEIPAAGMLVWRIDEETLQQRWTPNTVNNDRNRLGVGIVQADGRNDLSLLRCGVNCADGGDAYPGLTGNPALHAGSTPAARTHLGSASGLTLLDIHVSGTDVRFRALTRFQNVVVRTSGGSGALLTVDGQAVSGTQAAIRAAPFQTLTLEAAPGAPIAEGVRVAFERWMDAPSLTRVRSFVTGLEDAELVAEYGNRREVRLRVDIQGSMFGVAAGTIATAPASPDGWFPEGTPVGLTASATTGYGFLRWTGPLAGQANPALLEMSGPVDAGALFELTYRVPAGLRHQVQAAAPQEVVLVAENGAPPVAWTLLEGRLPEGLALRSEGVISGAALESGDFPLTLQAVDAAGLIATGNVTLAVARPAVGVQALVGPFLGNTTALNELQTLYLDRSGNRNGIYDLGDLRTFFLANRDLPVTAEQQAVLRTLLPAVTFGPRGGEP